jgi:hypothetical protein
MVSFFKVKSSWAKSDSEFPSYNYNIEVVTIINSYLNKSYFYNYENMTYLNNYELNPIRNNYNFHISTDNRYQRYLFEYQNNINNIFTRKTNTNYYVRGGDINFSDKISTQVCELFKLANKVRAAKLLSEASQLYNYLKVADVLPYQKVSEMVECLQQLSILNYLSMEAMTAFQNMGPHQRLTRVLDQMLTIQEEIRNQANQRRINIPSLYALPNNENQDKIDKRYEFFDKNKDNLDFRRNIGSHTNAKIRREQHQSDINFKDGQDKFRVPFWQSSYKGLKHGSKFNIESQINPNTGKREIIPTDVNVRSYMSSVYDIIQNGKRYDGLYRNGDRSRGGFKAAHFYDQSRNLYCVFEKVSEDCYVFVSGGWYLRDDQITSLLKDGNVT